MRISAGWGPFFEMEARGEELEGGEEDGESGVAVQQVRDECKCEMGREKER